jgi:pimeloyl-ACP methyl ester carboxylesterase
MSGGFWRIILNMSKPTIFLVHGYNGTPKIFSYFKDTFEQNGYEVVMPQFPTQTDITIDSYFAVFDQYKADLNDNTIIVAHSIGNIMSLKYLCENNIAIRGYVSLAGFGEPFINEGRDDLNSVIAPLRLTDEELAKLPALIKKPIRFIVTMTTLFRLIFSKNIQLLLAQKIVLFLGLVTWARRAA